MRCLPGHLVERTSSIDMFTFVGDISYIECGNPPCTNPSFIETDTDDTHPAPYLNSLKKPVKMNKSELSESSIYKTLRDTDLLYPRLLHLMHVF